MSGSAAVEVSELCYTQPGGRHRLENISFCVEPGRLTCLLGPNGSGKTTLLKCMLGILQAQHGTVRVFGRDLARMGSRERARVVAYMPQKNAITFPFTALDMVVMGRSPHLSVVKTPSRRDRERASREMCDLGVAHLSERPFNLLSGGEQSLVLLARALVQDTEVVLLDEPAAALDLGNTAGVLAALRQIADDGRTVIMTLHQPDHAMHVADQAVMLVDGSIVADGDPRVELTSQLMTNAYDTPILRASAVVNGSFETFSTFVPQHLLNKASTDEVEPQRING